MGTEHESEQEQNQEHYSFIQEDIKDEKNDIKKVLKKVLSLAGKGLIFGIAASLSFFALKPWLEPIFQKEANEVEIPKDEEIEEEEQTEEVNEANPILTIESYRELNKVLSQVAVEAEKSVVFLSGIQQDESWLTGQEENVYQTSGIVVADNGRELLVLANYSDMKDAQLFRVEFADGSEHEAVIKQKDGNIDLAVFSVAKGGISGDTWSKIKVAELGNSNIVKPSNLLIALGNPFGSQRGVGYGVASSVDETVNLADGMYDILITDMPNAERNSGILFDTYGKVMGIIDSDLSDEKGTLTAIAISGIKSEIELMSNGNNIPYIGIYGTIVSAEMSELQGIPVGLYVTEVAVDSPAMKAGIQSGDIVTEAAGRTISTYTDYHNTIIRQGAGQNIQIIAQRYGVESYVDIKFNVTVGIKQ